MSPIVSGRDTRHSEPQGMQQEMQQQHADFSAQASYVQPEILRVGGATIEQFTAAEPRLATDAFILRDIARRAAHTLSGAEEKILADAQPLAGSASNIYGILAKALFYAKSRKYASTIEASLDGPNTPVSVYSRLGCSGAQVPVLWFSGFWFTGGFIGSTSAGRTDERPEHLEPLNP